MPVNLSVKNVPDTLAERLRARASRNHRSLQRELLAILESVVDERSPSTIAVPPSTEALSIEEVVARARRRFPNGTESSIPIIRAMRDGR